MRSPQAEAEAEAAAEAEAQAQHEEAEAEIEAVVAEEEAEPEPESEPAAEAEQVPGGRVRPGRRLSRPRAGARNKSAQLSPQVVAGLWNSAGTSRSERENRPQASSGRRGNLCSLMPANCPDRALDDLSKAASSRPFTAVSGVLDLARWPSSPRPRRPPRSRRRISKRRNQSSAR